MLLNPEEDSSVKSLKKRSKIQLFIFLNLFFDEAYFRIARSDKIFRCNFPDCEIDIFYLFSRITEQEFSRQLDTWNLNDQFMHEIWLIATALFPLFRLHRDLYHFIIEIIRKMA